MCTFQPRTVTGWGSEGVNIVPVLCADGDDGGGVHGPGRPALPVTRGPTQPGAPSGRPAFPAVRGLAQPGAPSGRPALPVTRGRAQPGAPSGRPALPAVRGLAQPGAPSGRPALPAVRGLAQPGAPSGRPALPAVRGLAQPGAPSGRPALPAVRGRAQPGAPSRRSLQSVGFHLHHFPSRSGGTASRPLLLGQAGASHQAAVKGVFYSEASAYIMYVKTAVTSSTCRLLSTYIIIKRP